MGIVRILVDGYSLLHHWEELAPAKPLEKCPACKRPVRKIISGFSTPTHLKPLSITDAKKAGFTVYKKLGKGEYERQ